MKLKPLIPILVLIAGLFLILLRFQPVGGEVGHDYTHYFARLMMGADHFWKNGWSTPHFTPYLCGGMPFYADPQAIYHSVQQFLAFFVAPLLATHLTFIAFYLLGYWGAFRLLTEVFQCRASVAHFSSLLFFLNGFCFVHLVVGHITHYQFFLAPWILYALLRPTLHFRSKILQSAALVTVCVSYTIYSGGLHVALVFLAMLFLLLPFLLFRKAAVGELKDLTGIILLGAGLLGAVLSGKLMAAVRFSPVFVQGGVDVSLWPPWRLVLQYFWFDPNATAPFLMFGKWAFGIWEYVAFVSRLTIPALFLAPFLWIRSPRSIIVFGLTLFHAGVLMALATGHLGNAHLPFFKSYHNPIKLLSGFTPLFICIFAVVLEKLCQKSKLIFQSEWTRSTIYVLASLIVFAEFYINSIPIHTHPGARGVKYDSTWFTRLKQQGGLPPVERIMPYSNVDLPAAANGGTCLGCYEPLFGYRHEAFGSLLKLGPVQSIEKGTFNLHHPGCFLYGRELHCKPWDAIPLVDQSEFELFRSGRVVRGWVPRWQQWFDWFNSISFLICVYLMMGAPFWASFKVPLLRQRASEEVPA